MIKQSEFKPAWWLPNPHLQTIMATFIPRRKVPTWRERFELPDGDFLDLEWTGGDTGPIVIVLHGLGGSARSPYARGILRQIRQLGWRGVVIHFRGCSGELNRLARGYHSGDTADLAAVVAMLQQRYPGVPLAAVGYSLGGNVLLKWLGETGAANPLQVAVAVSVPLFLHIAANRVNAGVSRMYQWYMLRDLRHRLIKKGQQLPLPIAIEEIHRLRSFWEFDDKVTAKLHGFASVHDYYAQSSSWQYLKNIVIPTLILHAHDDPLLTKHILHSDGLSQQVILEVSRAGGHVGFISGSNPLRPRYWLEERIPRYLREKLHA